MKGIKPIFVENLELIISSGLDIPPIKPGHELIFERGPMFGRTGLKLTGIARIDEAIILPLIEGTSPEPATRSVEPPRDEGDSDAFWDSAESDDDDDVDDLWENSIFVPFDPIEDPPRKS